MWRWRPRRRRRRARPAGRRRSVVPRSATSAIGRIASLIETAKRNAVEPDAYLKATLDVLDAGHPASRIDELLPWAHTPAPRCSRSAPEALTGSGAQPGPAQVPMPAFVCSDPFRSIGLASRVVLPHRLRIL